MGNNATDSIHSKLRSVKTSDVARLMELFQVKKKTSYLNMLADCQSFFDRVLFSSTGNSFQCLMTDVPGYLETTTGERADGNRLTLVTRAKHVSRIIPTWTLVNPNHVGASDAGEGIKKHENGPMHQEAHAQRRVAIL